MTETTNNVVEFPRHKIVRENTVDAEVERKRKEKSLISYANSLVEEITENLLMDFDNSGVDVDTDTFAKDFHFLAGIITATVYRSMEIKHDLHQFIDERVRIVKEDAFDILKDLDTLEFDKLEELDKPT